MLERSVLKTLEDTYTRASSGIEDEMKQFRNQAILDFVLTAALLFTIVFILFLAILFNLILHVISGAEVILSSISSLSFIVFLGYYFISHSLKSNSTLYETRLKEALEPIHESQENDDGSWHEATRTPGLIAKKIVAMLPIFSAMTARLQEFERNRAQLQVFRQDISDSMSRYISIGKEVTNIIKTFDSVSLSVDSWIKELSLDMTALWNVDGASEIIKLMYYEYTHDYRLSTQWERIRTLDNGRLIRTLSAIYIQNDIISKIPGLSDDFQVAILIALMSKEEEDYSRKRITSSFNQYVEKIHDVVIKLDSVSKNYELNFTSETLLKSLPLTVEDDIEGFLLAGAANVANLDFTKLSMAYYLLEDQRRANKLYLELKKDDKDNKDNKLLPIISFLMDKRKIRTYLPSISVTEMIKTSDSFNIEVIQSKLDYAQDIIHFASELVEFSKEYKIPIVQEQNDVSSLLKLLDSSSSDGVIRDMPSLFVRVTKDLIAWRQYIPDLSPKEEELLNRSRIITTVFVNRRRNPYEVDCNKMAAGPWRIDINLFNLTKFIAKDPSVELAELIRKSFLQSSISEDDSVSHSEFQWRLLSGQFVFDFPTLMNSRFNDALSKQRALIKISQLEIFRKSVKEFFGKELKLSNIRDLTLGRVVQAYLITVPVELSNTSAVRPAVMTSLNDDKGIQAVIRELQTKNSDMRFKDLILPVKGSGWNTRIGIVPNDMSYSECSLLLEEVLRVHLRNSGNLHQLFMTRISATEESFRVLIRESQSDIDLFSKIKDLIKEHFPTDYQIALYISTNEQTIEPSSILEVIGRIVDTAAGGFLNLMNKEYRALFEKEAGQYINEIMMEFETDIESKLSTPNFHLACETLSRQSENKSQRDVVRLIDGSLIKAFLSKELEAKNSRALAREILRVAKMVSDVFTV